jgi:hypothetical protein
MPDPVELARMRASDLPGFAASGKVRDERVGDDGIASPAHRVLMSGRGPGIEVDEARLNVPPKIQRFPVLAQDDVEGALIGIPASAVVL